MEFINQIIYVQAFQNLNHLFRIHLVNAACVRPIIVIMSRERERIIFMQIVNQILSQEHSDPHLQMWRQSESKAPDILRKV